MIVAGPDGKNIDFGDLPQDQVQSAMQKLYPPKTSTASDVGKTLAGNVAPTAVANLAANAASVPATVGSYTAQLGTKAGEYLMQNAMGISPEESAAQQKDLKNAIREKVGLKATDESGDISNYVPTPANLVSGAASAIGHPLYQPKTGAGQATATLGNIASGALGSGVGALPAIGGAIGGYAAPEAIKALGGGEESQFFGGLAGGLAGGAAGSKAETMPSVQNFGTPESLSAKENAAVTPEVTPQHVPLKTASDLTDTIFDNLDRANKLYEFPKQIAGDQVTSAPQVRDYLSGVISDIQADPFHEARPMVGKLQKTLDELPENGEVPVSDLLDLRKTSNANFKPGRSSDKDGVYAGLNRAVNSGLDNARDNIPHFSDALDVADNYWKNSVSNPILKNKVLQKVFDMEDAHNVRQFNNGNVDELPDVTNQAANQLVSKIKDVDTYNAVRRLLPDESGQALDRAVLENIAPTRLDAAIRLIKSNVAHPIQSIHNIADILWPSVTPAQKALISAIKEQNSYTPISVKNEAADNAFNAVKSAATPQSPSISGLLPPPNRPNFIVSPEGQASAVPNKQIGPYQFGEGEGTPYQPGERAEVNARTGNYEQMPLASSKGQRAFKKSVNSEEDNGHKYGGSIPHKTWVNLVREHGKSAKVKMSQLKDPKARQRLLKQAGML